MSFLIFGGVHAESVTIIRACSSGQLQTYTDCETGQPIRRAAMAPGSNRFGSISADGKSFKVLISGGEGIYKVTVNLSNGQSFYVADYPAKSSAVNLTAEAVKLGWTSSGVEIFAPKDIKIVSSEWVNYIKQGSVFYVNFDTAKFDDTGWQSSGDPMGTLMAGKSYKVQYTDSSTSWSVTGFNEGTRGDYTTSYRTQSPVDYKLNLWGRVYTFNDNGEVFDSQYGPVGHLSKKPNDQVVFPIAELGNCKSEADCKTYCSKQENMMACANYGEKKGLISPEDLARTKEFADVLKGEGPGGCTDQTSCQAYCEDISHIDECVSFASKHNFIKADQLAEAQKVANALKQGVVLPGGCKDKASCDAFCNNSANADVCLEFAKKAGFLSEQELADAEKFLPLIKSGETPGKCKSKTECQVYCDDEKNVMECINFAEKAGMATKEEADMVRKTGGKGPGGCKSKDSCEALCNQKEYQNECFEFAKKYNLIPPEKLKEIEDGMGRLRAGLDQMPSEAIQCLKDNLGEGIIGEIESGRFTPGPATGETIKSCFDKVLPQLQAKLQEGLQQATPEVLQCLKKNMGEDGLAKLQGGEAPTPENGDALKTCFESMKQEGMKKFKEGLAQMPEEMKTCLADKIGADTLAKIESGQEVEITQEMGAAAQTCAADVEKVMMEKMQQGLQGAPPEISNCIQSKLGNVSEKMRTGELKGQSDIDAIIQSCVANFKPSGGAGMPGGAGIPANIPEEYKNMIPEGLNIPNEMPKDLESLQELQEQYQNMAPQGVPSGIPSLPPSGSGQIPSGMPQVDCSVFASVPSCSMTGPGEALCKQCFPNK